MPLIFHPTFYISAIVQHVMQALVSSSLYEISWLVKQISYPGTEWSLWICIHALLKQRYLRMQSVNTLADSDSIHQLYVQLNLRTSDITSCYSVWSKQCGQWKWQKYTTEESFAHNLKFSVDDNG